MTHVDLGEAVLDHQLLDRDGRRCGKVDDLELAGLDRDDPHVVELLVGPAALRTRGLLGRLVAHVSRGHVRHVAWEQVDTVRAAVTLRSQASSLGLGRGDDRARHWVQRIPGAHR